MSIEEKMKNAKNSSWLTKGLTKEEVKDIVVKAKRKAEKEMARLKGE